MYSSRSTRSGKTLEEDLESLYTSRPIDVSERPTPRYSKSNHTPAYTHKQVPPLKIPLSIPSTVRECPTDDYDEHSPARREYSTTPHLPTPHLPTPHLPTPHSSTPHLPTPHSSTYTPTHLVEKKKHNYVVPAKYPGDEPISPICFVPTKGAMTAKTHNSKVTAIHGDASSFKYDKQKGKVHVMISGNAKTRFQTEDFEFVLEVGKSQS